MGRGLINNRLRWPDGPWFDKQQTKMMDGMLGVTSAETTQGLLGTEEMRMVRREGRGGGGGGGEGGSVIYVMLIPKAPTRKSKSDRHLQNNRC